jgi:serine/alanine adding enzyme
MLRRGVHRVELRHAHPVPARGLPTRDDKVLMRLALPATEDELFKRVGPKMRADIRRPEKEGMTATVGGAELLPEFHAVYAAVMRDLGSPCHSLALFRACFARMPERSFVCVVRYEGRPVGGGYLVGMGDTLEIPCAGTLHAMNRLRPNMLLYWTVLREAIRRGYRAFSFGRSSADSGTFTFKKNWGAEAHPLTYHYLLRPARRCPTCAPTTHVTARSSRPGSTCPWRSPTASGRSYFGTWPDTRKSASARVRWPATASATPRITAAHTPMRAGSRACPWGLRVARRAARSTAVTR